VVELIQEMGGTVVPSEGLVTVFASRWSDQDREGHLRAAEALAAIAREVLADTVNRGGTNLTECAVQSVVVEKIKAAGLVFDHPPIVAFGANAADPHYSPIAGQDARLEKNQVVLLDLWSGPSLDSVFADQTWMGFSGPKPPDKVREVWEVVRRARDAAITLVQKRIAAGETLRGFEIDRAARDVIEAAGYGDWFVHRTGHSIDHDLHGSGPHCDDYESHDDRELIPGVGFSIEPGIYLTGDFGVRTEVDMFWGPEGAVVTPREIQVEMILGR
jgi:Xaa-Pro aminopeptidase